MSCAVPGMNRNSFGNCRSIFISPLPPGLEPLRLPRNFLSQAIAPSASPAHVELADPGQLHDFAAPTCSKSSRRNWIAAGSQRRHHRADMIVEEQHGRDRRYRRARYPHGTAPAPRHRCPIRRRRGPRVPVPENRASAISAHARPRRTDDCPWSRRRPEPVSRQRAKCALAS